MAKTTTELRRAIKRYISGLQKHIRVDTVILFGSYANGHPHKWSDIDLAVISPDFDGKDWFERVKLMGKARAARDIDIEAIGYGKQQYETAHRQTFLGEIIRTGKVVYQAPKRTSHGQRNRRRQSRA
jgi:uncharacterized protein